MKFYDRTELIGAVSRLIDRSLRRVEDETVRLLEKAHKKESSSAAKWALSSICKNAELARLNDCFACQDCGLALLFVSLGRDAILTFDIEEALNEGVRIGYRDARKSVADPLNRDNTGDNTPAVIYTEIVEGDFIEVSYLAKGAGSENMSAVYMLTPSKGRDGIIECAVDCVKKAGANPCPPIILGIGIGGTMDKAAVLSKKALLRRTATENPNKDVAALEKDILSAVNALNVGAQGFGGETTALAVHAETFPTHIGMLPVAITIQCHSVRHGNVTVAAKEK